jgi:hypothetical protein
MASSQSSTNVSSTLLDGGAGVPIMDSTSGESESLSRGGSMVREWRVLTFGKTQKKGLTKTVACYCGFGMKAPKALVAPRAVQTQWKSDRCNGSDEFKKRSKGRYCGKDGEQIDRGAEESASLSNGGDRVPDAFGGRHYRVDLRRQKHRWK